MSVSPLFLALSLGHGTVLSLVIPVQLRPLQRVSVAILLGLMFDTWLCFFFACFLGLSSATVLYSLAAATIFCGVALAHSRLRHRLRMLALDDGWRRMPTARDCLVALAWCVPTAAIFSRVLEDRNGALGVNYATNGGDLPLHVSYITSMALGGNVPPEDPTFPGIRLAYPILADFLAALFVMDGWALEVVFFVMGTVLSLCFIVILHWFCEQTLDARAGAGLCVVLFVLGGGWGAYYFVLDALQPSWSLSKHLLEVPTVYSADFQHGMAYVNPVIAMLVPQRAFLFGFPATVLTLGLLYCGARDASKSAFLAAGVLGGFLPAFHITSCGAIAVVASSWTLLRWNRAWLHFYLPVLLIAVPQVLLMLPGDGPGSESFVRWSPGWLKRDSGFVWFWLLNLGMFVPLAIYGSVLRKGFYLSMWMLFAVPNLFRLFPVPWDNTKVLVYFHIMALPLVVTALRHVQSHGRAGRWAASAAAVSMMVTGAIDVLPGMIPRARMETVYTADDREAAAFVQGHTAPDEIVMTGGIANSFVGLSGRRVFLGSAHHARSHGRSPDDRARALANALSGSDLSPFRDPRVRHAVVDVKTPAANAEFYEQRYPRVFSNDSIRIYRVAR